MSETFIRYGIFTLIFIIPMIAIIVGMRKRSEENQSAPTGTIRQESMGGRIGAAIMMFGISALCVWAASLFFAEFSSLSREGIETTITIMSFDKVERENHKKSPDTYDEYYTISYVFEGTTKEKTFIYDSKTEARDFADGEVLPAVVQNPQAASEIQAPATKKSLLRDAWIFSGTTGLFAILFSAAGIRILTRKPQQLIKDTTGKYTWHQP